MTDSFHLTHAVKPPSHLITATSKCSVVKRIIENHRQRIEYQSPTDVGVNCAGFSIVDDEAVREAILSEIIRRYLIALVVLKGPDRKLKP